MPLPLLTKCCWRFPHESGCFVLCVISILACLANITVGAWCLPRHRERDPEDNLISMSMIMFSSLSMIGNIVALTGIWLKRASNLQLSFIFNSVFIVCIFLVTIVNCIFRLEKYFKTPGNITLVILAFIVGAVYSIYYLLMLNSVYRIMKISYSDSPIPI